MYYRKPSNNFVDGLRFYKFPDRLSRKLGMLYWSLEAKGGVVSKVTILQLGHTDHTHTQHCPATRINALWTTSFFYVTYTASPHAIDQSLGKLAPPFLEESPEMCECVVCHFMCSYCPPQLIPQMLNGIQIRWSCRPLHHINLVLLEVSCCNSSSVWMCIVLLEYGICAHLDHV